MSINLKLKGTFYNALRTVSAKNDVRYYLNGIMIDFEKKRWAATDGHRLLTVPMDMDICEWEDFDTTYLPKQLIVGTTRQKITGTDCELKLDFFYGQWTILIGNIRGLTMLWQESVQVIDGKFPDIDRVIPPWPDDPKTVPLVAYNPLYLHDIAFELKLKNPSVRVIPPHDGLGALMVEFQGIPRPNLTYVLMGMRWP